MNNILANVLYSLTALAAFGFAAYAPTFTEKATAGVSPQLFAAGDEIYGYVVGVMDGDTIKLRTEDRRELRVRLSQIDAPEKGQPFGDVAKRSLSDLAYNKPAGVRVSGTDSTGKIIGRVYIGTLDLNLAQVGRGLAWADMTSSPGDERIAELMDRARQGRVGLWSEDNPVAPWEFVNSEG